VASLLSLTIQMGSFVSMVCTLVVVTTLYCVLQKTRSVRNNADRNEYIFRRTPSTVDRKMYLLVDTLVLDEKVQIRTHPERYST
jgi:hypothetical protein